MTMLPFGQIAPVSRRVMAYVIDALIAFAVAMVFGIIGAALVINSEGDAQIGAMFGASALVLVGAAAWAVAFTVMQGGAGSLGMRALKLRLAHEESGTRIGFGKALLRNIVFWLTGTIVVGYFSPLFDSSGRSQGWHDKAVGVLMLDSRSGEAATTALATPAFIGAPPTEHSPLANLASPTAMPAPAAPPAPEHASTPAVPEAPLPAQPNPPVAADPVIAWVPGVTQDGPPSLAPSVPAERATPAVSPIPENLPPVPPLPPLPTGPLEVTVLRDDVAAASGSEPDDDDIEQTRISIPGHRLVFTWDDGTKVAVSQRTLFGRNPAPEAGAVAVAVRDETLSLSKTHFEASADVRGGWIMDRHSTNGTMLVRDGHRTQCEPGEKVSIRLGDALEIGDRIVTIGGYA